jgi:hypothetical protein
MWPTENGKMEICISSNSKKLSIVVYFFGYFVIFYVDHIQVYFFM